MAKFTGKMRIALKIIFSAHVFFFCMQVFVFKISSILYIVDFDVVDFMYAKSTMSQKLNVAQNKFMN